MSRRNKAKKGKASKNKTGMAATADRHFLYQESVQCVESEIDFVDETFAKLRNRNAVRMREDFCGTANTSCEWVRRRPDNEAVGVDLDIATLDWGRQHNLNKLEAPERLRVTLMNDDVMTAQTPPVDMLLAMNFSYWVFKDRATLKAYFEAARAALADDGIFFLDCFGGYEAYQRLKEETEYDDFSYVWDQDYYNPINGDLVCHITFKFPDGSKMKRAFTYEWRLWSLPEISELLVEAGFTRSTVYWEGSDDDGEGDGVFTAAEEGEADAGWITYIVAEK